MPLVGAQNPVRLDEHSEPQPDLVLLRLQSDYYASSHPTPADVLLVVEVADTSATLDRQVKLPLYARSAIPESWIADLNADILMVYRDPTPMGYRLTLTLRRGDRVTPLAFPDREIAVADILG